MNLFITNFALHAPTPCPRHTNSCIRPCMLQVYMFVVHWTQIYPSPDVVYAAVFSYWDEQNDVMQSSHPLPSGGMICQSGSTLSWVNVTSASADKAEWLGFVIKAASWKPACERIRENLKIGLWLHFCLRNVLLFNKMQNNHRNVHKYIWRLCSSLTFCYTVFWIARIML